MGRVFLDGIGFREAGVRLAQPVTARGRADRSVTVAQLVSTPESSVVVYEVEWRGEQNIHPQADRVVLHGASTDPACRPGGLRMAVREGKLVVSRTLPPVADGVRNVDLEIAGDAGEWRLALELEPFGSEEAAYELDASDTRHSITLAVRGVIRRQDTTILDIAVPVEPGRRIDIGGLNGLRDETTGMNLRDQHGRVYPERVRADARDQFPELPGQDVGVFDALAPDAGAVLLEVPFVSVHDHTASVDVPLPVVSPVEVTLGDARLRVVATRTTHLATPRYTGAALVIEIESDWTDDRRVVWVSSARLDGDDRGVIHGGTYAPAPELQRELKIVNDAPAEARVLTLRAPTLQIRGPWQIPLGML